MDIVIRIACVFILLTLAMRVMGKRELSQLSPFELVMLLLVAEIVAPALTPGDASLTAALFGAATLLTLTLLHSILTYRFKAVRMASESEPALVVRRGRLVEEVMHKDRVRADEIFSEMHKAGIERLADVKWAWLEPDGKMSFVRADGGDTNEPPEHAPV